MNICDIMTDKVVSVSSDEPVSVAARLLKRHNVGSLPVCDSAGRLRGIITDRDIVTRCIALGSDPDSTSINEVMSRAIVTASPSASVDEAVQLMSRDQIRRLPITEDGKLVGMVALCDIARHSNCQMEASAALCEISANIKRK